jgi:hypothetical protein
MFNLNKSLRICLISFSFFGQENPTKTINNALLSKHSVIASSSIESAMILFARNIRR